MGPPSSATTSSLSRVVAEHQVERAIIAPGTDGQDEILDAIRLVKALGVKVSVLPAPARGRRLDLHL